MLRRTLREPPAIIFAALFTLFMATMASLVVVVIAQQAATLGYSRTEATVIRAAGPEFGSGLRYGFSVNGEDFEGERTRAGMIAVDITAVRDQSHITSLAPGDPVTVYYSPDDPAQSVLYRGIDGWLFVALGAQLPFWIVLGALWLAIRWARSAHSE